jgi:hypothetical protein
MRRSLNRREIRVHLPLVNRRRDSTLLLQLPCPERQIRRWRSTRRHSSRHPHCARTSSHPTFACRTPAMERSRAPISTLLKPIIGLHALPSGNQSLNIIFLFLFFLRHRRIRILHNRHTPHILKLRDARPTNIATAMPHPLTPTAGPCTSVSILSPLCLDLLRPPLHHLLGREADDEVLDTGVAFPENLARVRTCAKRRISTGYDQNIPAHYISDTETTPGPLRLSSSQYRFCCCCCL